MSMPAVGDLVQTPLGKGVVREVRRNGNLVVIIGNRSVVVTSTDVTMPAGGERKAKQARRAGSAGDATGDAYEAGYTHARPVEIDLHGCTVDEAMEKAMAAIDAALVAGRMRVRIIHGRGGGRIRAALHARLRQLPPVRAFRLDPANPGVTLVDL